MKHEGFRCLQDHRVAVSLVCTFTQELIGLLVFHLCLHFDIPIKMKKKKKEREGGGGGREGDGLGGWGKKMQTILFGVVSNEILLYSTHLVTCDGT